MTNQTSHNVWIQQPLLASEIFLVQHIPWDYGVGLHQEGDKIEMAFQPLPSADIMAFVKAVHNEPDQVPWKEASQEPHPTFGPHPNTQVADFEFKKRSRVSFLQAQSGRHSFRQRTLGQIYQFDLK